MEFVVVVIVIVERPEEENQDKMMIIMGGHKKKKKKEKKNSLRFGPPPLPNKPAESDKVSPEKTLEKEPLRDRTADKAAEVNQTGHSLQKEPSR
jgi:hypothetical protein